MKPVEFKNQNIVYAKDQKEYQPLPALKFEDGTVVSCWKMKPWERIKILITGRIWLNLLSFNKPLTPSYLAVNRKEVFSITEDKLSFFDRIIKVKNKLINK